MFSSARLKLTAWYVLLIMLVSGLFSAAFYNSSTREIQRLINRIEFSNQFEPDRNQAPPPFGPSRNFPTVAELEQVKQKSFVTLLIINGIILVLSAGASYLLALKTLKPLQEMVEEQNEFVSNASHELRTPIANLRAEMESNLLEEKISDAMARRLITSNLEDLDRLQSLTNNLLRLAQSKTAVTILPKPASLSVVIEAAQKNVKTLAKKQDIRFQTSLPKVLVLAQKESLTELFVILFDNAVKYSPKHAVVTVVAKKVRSAIQISVTDTGIGISPADIDHIFKRFYRADKSRSQYGGYGLGLSIAQTIVRQHEGTLTVKSKLGKGSTFIVTLPILSNT